MYISHMRSEGDRLLESIDELIEISRRSGAPAEIYHLKQAGRANWGKLDAGDRQGRGGSRAGPADHRRHVHLHRRRNRARRIDAALGSGRRQRSDAGTPPRSGRRRARQARDASSPVKDWENLYLHAGPEGVLLASLTEPSLKPFIGKTVAEVAKMRGVTPEQVVIDLVLADQAGAARIYFLMSEDNVKRQTALPWMSFGSDAEAAAPEGVFLKSSTHPRAYGNFARLLGQYVRDEQGRSACRRGTAPDLAAGE